MAEARQILQALVDLGFPIPIVAIGVWIVGVRFNAEDGYTPKELLLSAIKVGAGVAVASSIFFLNAESGNIISILRAHPVFGIPLGIFAVLGLSWAALMVYLHRKRAVTKISILHASDDSAMEDPFQLRGLFAAWCVVGASGIVYLWVISRQ